MRVRREYTGWDPSDRLDPEADAVLAFLDELSLDNALCGGDEVIASIDEYGVVRAEVKLRASAELFVQAGDGWGRVLWTCPSGRTHEWIWRDGRTPDDLAALIAGRGVERTVLLGSRRVAVGLVVDGRDLAMSQGGLRLAVLRRLGMPLSHNDTPAL